MDGTDTPRDSRTARASERLERAGEVRSEVRSEVDGEVDSDSGFDSFLAALASSPPPYRPPHLEGGDVFAGRYQIVRELGRGGMGTVYLAQDLELERNVAVKVAAGRRADVALARLQKEATVMAQLSHPGIVTVFEASSVGDDVFISLEFVPGGTLKDWSDLQPRGWREAVSMYLPIAKALAAAHEAGVIHRDFKPHNVLLGLDGQPRIADFGLARSLGTSDTLRGPITTLSTMTRSGAVMGTPAYMSPEQAHGRDAASASDQFSFFVSLYETICGARPFGGATLHAVLEAIESGAPPRCPGMPRALAAVVRRGLAAEPGRRFGDMNEVAAALDRILHARRRRVQVSVLGLGVAVAAGLGFAAAPASAEPCAVADARVSLSDIWNAQVESDLRAGAGPKTAAALGAFGETLVDERVATCKAHAVAHTLSDDDLALSSACLDRIEGRFAGLVEDLQQTPRALESADELLPSPQRCKDVQALRRAGNGYASRSDFQTTTQDQAMKSAERLLTRALLRAERSESIEPFASELLEIATEHQLSDMRAYALLVYAGAASTIDEQARLTEEAASAAGSSTNADLLRDLAVRRSDIAIRDGELGLARAYLENADTLARVGLLGETSQPDDTDRELLRVRIGVESGETQGHVATLENLLKRIPGDSAQALEAQTLLADLLADRFEIARADEIYTRALSHPRATDPETRYILRLNRAVALVFGGRAKQALASLDAARDELDAVPPHLKAATELARAGAHRLEGELEAARTTAEAVRASLTDLQPDHPALGHVLYELTLIDLAANDPEGALEHAAGALERWDAANGPGSVDAGRTLIAIAQTFRALGRSERAEAAAQVSIDILVAKGRPAGEVALAKLALDPGDAKARDTCAESELQACRDVIGLLGLSHAE